MDVTYRFLFDECLSPDLSRLANSLGFDATHVQYLDRLGTSDRSLALFAVENDFVFVTNNRVDFVRLFAKLEIHCGLVIILPNCDTPNQARLFAGFVAALPDLGDITNKRIDINESGELVAVEWPPRQSNEPPL